MLRVFYEKDGLQAGTEVVLDSAESRHLKVRRARVGEGVAVLDGRGGLGRGVVTEVGGPTARVRIAGLEQSPPPRPVTLAVGLPKGDVFAEIIRQAVELGAAGLQPLLTEHTEVKLDAEAAAKKVGRWRAAAIEACKQSGNPWLPEIFPAAEFGKWLAGLTDARAKKQARLVAALTSDAAPLSQIETWDSKLETLIAVGPEGDFSPEEYKKLTAVGFAAVRLPGHVLRVETACAAALALLNAAP